MSMAGPVIKEQEREIVRLRALLKECQAVLEFYGDEASWNFARLVRDSFSGHVYEYWEMDGGPAEARDLLAKLKEPK
jgi:hypothetical protein